MTNEKNRNDLTSWVIVVTVCCLLMTGSVMATEPQDPEVCLEATMECQDATSYGGEIVFTGTVTNCNDFPLDAVYVQEYPSDLNLIEPQPLGPGESISWTHSYVPDSADCPYYQKVWVRGYAFDWTVAKRFFLEDTCDCGPTLMAICRTPGFYGTHAGDAKDNSQNVTQAIIDAAGGQLNVCGGIVDNTDLEVLSSAIEGMCVHPRGETRLQLANHLTAAALNCVVTGTPIDCDGTGIEDLFRDCNDECALNADPDAMETCRKELDCWNNGGNMLGDGFCQLGTCAGDGVPCAEDDDCGFTDLGESVACLPLQDTCHDRPLVNEELGLYFDPPGSAGSSRECNKAIKNDCTLFDCN